MEKTERVTVRLRKRGPIGARGFQKHKCADDVGLDEICGPGNRPVDMAFGGEMHDPLGPEPGHGLRHRPGIADIGLEEAIIRSVRDQLERGLVAGIGQGVEVEHFMPVRHQMPNQRRSDESGTTCHQNAHAIKLPC